MASQRIIDHIPLTIELSLNRALCTHLENWLVQKLDIGGLDAVDRLKALISQDPHITATREKLTAELSKLKDVQRELRSLRLLQYPSNNYHSIGNNTKSHGFLGHRSDKIGAHRMNSITASETDYDSESSV